MVQSWVARNNEDVVHVARAHLVRVVPDIRGVWSVGGVDVESESVGSGVDVALEPKRGRRIESLSRGHSNHRRASVIERANGIVEYGNELTDRRYRRP